MVAPEAGGILSWPTSLWRDWLGWLPDFLRDVVFTIAAYLVLRLLFRYTLPVGGRIGRPVALAVVHGLAWLAVLPEYLATWIGGRLNRSVPGSFAYGEAIAGLLETSESSTRRGTDVMAQKRLPAGKLTFWSVALILVISNALAFHSHNQLSLIGW